MITSNSGFRVRASSSVVRTQRGLFIFITVVALGIVIQLYHRQVKQFELKKCNMRIKSNVARIMTENGLTVRGFAEKANLAPRTIMNARDDEAIKACSITTLMVIAHALGCRVKDLFEED